MNLFYPNSYFLKYGFLYINKFYPDFLEKIGLNFSMETFPLL